jgi:two-component system LytT family response regulator
MSDEAPPLRVLVADDEEMARRRLLRLLAALPEVRVAGECADGDEVLERLGAGGVDVVLLDVQMPNLSGLDALGLWPPDGPLVVFCTAHAQHAISAFDVGALDYLLKPVEPARLKRALQRAREADTRRRFAAETERQREQRTARGAPDGFPARLAIETRQGIVLLAPQEITHLELAGALVTVHTQRGDFLCDLPLNDLEAQLAPHGFLRAHRKTLLNLAHVTRLEPAETGGFVARTAGGHAVEVSRLAARTLRKRLGLR